MSVPSPANIALDPTSVPAWAPTVQTAINAALAANWAMGQQSRSVTISAAQLGLQQFPANALALLDVGLGEYRAAGWQTGTTQLSPTQIRITFDRW